MWGQGKQALEIQTVHTVQDGQFPQFPKDCPLVTCESHVPATLGAATGGISFSSELYEQYRYLIWVI